MRALVNNTRIPIMEKVSDDSFIFNMVREGKLYRKIKYTVRDCYYQYPTKDFEKTIEIARCKTFVFQEYHDVNSTVPSEVVNLNYLGSYFINLFKTWVCGTLMVDGRFPDKQLTDKYVHSFLENIMKVNLSDIAHTKDCEFMSLIY